MLNKLEINNYYTIKLTKLMFSLVEFNTRVLDDDVSDLYPFNSVNNNKNTLNTKINGLQAFGVAAHPKYNEEIANNIIKDSKEKYIAMFEGLQREIEKNWL